MTLRRRRSRAWTRATSKCKRRANGRISEINTCLVVTTEIADVGTAIAMTVIRLHLRRRRIITGIVIAMTVTRLRRHLHHRRRGIVVDMTVIRLRRRLRRVGENNSIEIKSLLRVEEAFSLRESVSAHRRASVYFPLKQSFQFVNVNFRRDD